MAKAGQGRNNNRHTSCNERFRIVHRCMFSWVALAPLLWLRMVTRQMSVCK
uniref:Uncharacterized protein n=1 Tax=Arundo donax TaxID=35708 RepID=A0A0A9FLP6_ARUDO